MKLDIKKNIGLMIITLVLIIFAVSYKYNYSYEGLMTSIGTVYLWFIYSISTVVLILMFISEKLFIHVYNEFIKVNSINLTLKNIINIIILMLLSLILWLSNIYNLAILLIFYVNLELYTRYRYFKFSKVQQKNV